MRVWLIEALLFLLYFAFGMSWFAFSPLGGDIQAFYQISKLQAGALFSLVSAAKAFVPVLAGLLVGRLGLKRSLWIGTVFCSLSMVVPFSPDYKTMLVLRFLFGVGGALVFTLTGPIVMQLFPRERLPLINGINNVAVNAGIVSQFLLVPHLAEHFSWRTILVGLGVVSALLSGLWWLFGSDAGASAGRKETASFAEVARRPETWWLALAFAGPLAIYLALNTFLPSHFEQHFGLDRASASNLTSLFNLVGIPTALISGWATGRLGLRRPLIIAAGLLMPVASLTLCFAPWQGLRLAAAVALGVSLFLYTAPLFTIPMELPGSNPAFVARMNGVIISGAYLLSMLSPMVVGYLHDRTHSYAQGLGFFCVTSSLLALGGLMVSETGPRGRRGPEEPGLSTGTGAAAPLVASAVAVSTPLEEAPSPS